MKACFPHDAKNLSEKFMPPPCKVTISGPKKMMNLGQQSGSSCNIFMNAQEYQYILFNLCVISLASAIIEALVF